MKSKKNLTLKRALTGAAVFAVIFAIASTTYAAGSSLKLVSSLSGKIDAGQTQTLKWSSNGSIDQVKVNLIKKVGSNPNRYSLVRTVAVATKNDGSAIWVPAKTDVGTALSIEIGCVASKTACVASAPSAQIAVINDGKYKNTAAAYKAIEASKNK
jgi:hypothetical protein